MISQRKGRSIVLTSSTYINLSSHDSFIPSTPVYCSALVSVYRKHSIYYTTCCCMQHYKLRKAGQVYSNKPRELGLLTDLCIVGITCHGHADSATNYVVDKRSDADATTDYVGGKCSDADSVTNLGTTSLTKGVNSAREDLRILKQVLGLYLQSIQEKVE